MHIIPFEIPPPKNEADFERMCAQVYGVVLNDRMPKMNGRRGQVQGGVDVFVKEAGVGRVGIQCKKYTMKPVKWEDVEDEVGKADKHKTPIKKLILATTAPNDAPLLKKVQELSDDREAKGQFPVEVEFWEDICNHIDRFPVLQDSYAPHTPGAAFHRQEASLNAISDIVLETNATVRSIAGLPPARADSVDRLISDQLDRTNELLKAGRYRDALDHLAVVGKDLEPFDAHQKARWYLQKGLGLWLMRVDDQESAGLFLKAFEVYPDDERMAAAQVRGLMLQKRLDEARAAGESALERFPDSQQVWFVLANVRLLQGVPVQMTDVPEALKQEPDTLQFVAQAELKAGNLDEAIKLSQESANHPAAGFFIRANALRIAAECGSRFPVAGMVGALPVRETKALEFAVGLFNPLHERLWNVQSESVGETGVHLGYALLMLHRFPEALAFARDAEAHGYRSAEILRIQLTALFELDREGELLGLSTERLAEMNSASLSIVGQVAAKDGNLALLKQTLDAALACDPVDDETTELLAALRWDALMRTDQQDTAVSEVLAAKVEVAGGLLSACIAARVLNRAGRTLEADAIVQRAKALVTPESTDAERLLVSTVTKAMLEESLRETEEDRSVATSTEVNGELALIEHDARYHTRRIEFFKAVLAAVEMYCEVQPAYGELENEGEMPRLADVLQDEEMEVLLLAKAANATVLTLDGRFRFVLEVVAKVTGVWPQALLMHCSSKNLVNPMKLASATIRQFLLNRSFVSLGSGDLTWMVMQGGVFLQQGMRRFKFYLSSDDTEFTSVVSVAFEFLEQIASFRIHLGAFGELFEHVVEAAMRHKQCPPDFERHVTNFIVDLTRSANKSTHVYGPANAIPAKRIQLQRRHLANRFMRARDRLKAPADNRPVAVRAVFCSSIPVLVEDKSSPVAESATEVQLQTQTAEPAQAQAAVSNEESPQSGQVGKAFLVAEPAARLSRR